MDFTLYKYPRRTGTVRQMKTMMCVTIHYAKFAKLAASQLCTCIARVQILIIYTKGVPKRARRKWSDMSAWDGMTRTSLKSTRRQIN